MQSFPYDGELALSTKAHWLELARRLATAESARRQRRQTDHSLTLPWAGYPQHGAEFEALCRPLWVILPALLGCEAEGNPLPAWLEEEVIGYRQSLLVGTNPENPDAWPPLFDHDQRLVDATLFGLVLALQPRLFGETMTPQQRARMVAWFGRCRECAYGENNWRFFRIFVLLGLQVFIEEWPEAAPLDEVRQSWQECIEADLQMLDGFYLDQGWYKDGADGLRDYYVPFGFHFYGLLFGHFCPGHRLTPVFRQRVCEFLEVYGRLFDTEGAGIAYGRSQTYRFAQASLFSICLTCGLYREADNQVPEWFTQGTLRDLLTRHLRYWLRQPIFSSDGTLSVGYGYPNHQMAEEYNAFGSPGWGFKFFWFLALPEGHPFWTAEALLENPLPDGDSAQAEAHWLVRRTEGGAHAWFLNAGQWRESWMPRHAEEKYAKFAYSSRFGFAVSTAQRRLFHTAVDSSLAASEDGEYWRLRGRTVESQVTDSGVVSTWRPWPGPRHDTAITSWLIPLDAGHLRIHRVVSTEVFFLAEGGFACPDEGEPCLEPLVPTAEKERTVFLRSGTLSVGGRLLATAGAFAEVAVTEHRLAPQAHLLFPQAHIPLLTGQFNGSAESPGGWLLSLWHGGVTTGNTPEWMLPVQAQIQNPSENSVVVHLCMGHGEIRCLEVGA